MNYYTERLSVDGLEARTHCARGRGRQTYALSWEALRPQGRLSAATDFVVQNSTIYRAVKVSSVGLTPAILSAR
jgi:hypothetical protein